MQIEWLKSIRDAVADRLDESRIRLARPDALVPLAVLGLLTGLLAGAVIVAFRLFVEGIQEIGLPGEGAENYEGLPVWVRFVIPLIAALMLAMMFRWFARGVHVLGVARVMERMAYHQGRCNVRAFFLQFFGAAIAIVGGHSVGREGPHIFLGASSGSLLGQAFALPNNVIRALVGCGTAAGIAASFNTPLAGVVFALEVVMMEYTVASFIPVILAAVSATALSNLVFGDAPAFIVPAMAGTSPSELALVLLIGAAAGAVSAGFVQAIESLGRRTRDVGIGRRMLLAGAVVGLMGMLLPEIMGIGYDTVGLALNSRMAVALLLMLLIGKLVATSVCIGLGVPGGMIGPSLFIGATLGALIAELASPLVSGMTNPTGFFALVGMGAMMSGSLQAPLAALTAMLELTDQPEIILPGMLAVVVAGLTASEVFGKDSLFLTMLRAKGLDYAATPIHQALRRVGVASVMERSFSRVGATVERGAVDKILAGKPTYLVIDVGDEQLLMLAAELARHLESSAAPGTPDEEKEVIDLLSIPGQRMHLEPIAIHANLQEAWSLFAETSAEALVVNRVTAPGIHRIYGILTPEILERSYR